LDRWLSVWAGHDCAERSHSACVVQVARLVLL